MDRLAEPLAPRPRISLDYPRVKSSHHCNDSDGLNFCDCQLNEKSIEECMYYGRHVEPLAFSLKIEDVVQQDECPLFTFLPKEIRDMIYEYALTDCTSHLPSRDNPFRRYRGDKSTLPPSDIAFSLLRTCRVVYVETYRFPLELNPFIVYDFQGPTRPNWENLAPWQFALVQRLDISMQQIALERGELAGYIDAWKAKDRQEDTYIAPRFYQPKHQFPRSLSLIQSFNTGLLKASEIDRTDPKDGDEVILSNKATFYHDTRSHYPIRATARAMIARPLTHLTLRLTRTDWWTWGDDPDSIGPGQRLHLDPALGNHNVDQMLQYAAKRREGQHLPHRNNWGAIIEALPALKVLELVLETFDVKKRQLDTVVECAMTWTFPLKDSPYELVWDGKVEEANWGGEVTRWSHVVDEDLYDALEDEIDEEIDEDDELSIYEEEVVDDADENEQEENWAHKSRNFEVRIVRFKRKRAG